MVTRSTTTLSTLTLLALLAACLWIVPTHAQEQQAAELPPRVYATIVMGAASPPAPPAATVSEWLVRLNAYRALANLPPLTENAAWSAGAAEHSRYVVKNNDVTHTQDANKPFATPAGAEAGRNGNVMAHSGMSLTDLMAIESWMQAPFHALGMIDPRLAQTGYGSYREADGGYQTAATLDVIRGIDWSRATSDAYPVYWPASGKVLPYTAYRGGEWPNPLSSCPGYQAPSGAPLYVQMGAGNRTPQVSSSSLMSGGQPVEHCVYTEVSYTNSDSTAQSFGRSILGSRDAVVIIPRAPLTPGASYEIALTIDGALHAWSFSVAPSAVPSEVDKDAPAAASEVAEVAEGVALAEPPAE